ncbi:MAG: DUF3301 domain-containing protein [Rhodocyclaceae bacterium]|jgi:hypothetical protein|nr:MAG: DUF3301 domain-containing protein [Rhodocyclaceae bacterium]
MTTLELTGFLLLAALLWLWMDSLKAREACLRESRAACAAEGLLLLDDTVAVDSIRPARDDEGRLRLKRVYRFEYSDTGNNRRTGAVTLLGDRVVTFYLGPQAV